MRIKKIRSASAIHCICIALLVSAASMSPGSKSYADDKIQIVTDIAPVHSLVSMVAGDLADITLLVPPSQSPHIFSLKPSQRRAMGSADLIVILGDDFTPTLNRHLQAVADSNRVLRLPDMSDLANEQPADDHALKAEPDDQPAGTQHDDRTQDAGSDDHAQDAHSDDHVQGTQHSDHSSPTQHDHERGNHTWLDPVNAIRWIDLIAAALINIDAQHQPTYQQNAAHAEQLLSELNESIKHELQAVQSSRYIVNHDAYQHFAHRYGLQTPVAIALSDARAPSAKKIKAVQQAVADADCAFSELLHDDALVNLVSADYSIRRGILDPTGSLVPLGPKHYTQTMQALADNFLLCLQP